MNNRRLFVLTLILLAGSWVLFPRSFEAGFRFLHRRSNLAKQIDFILASSSARRGRLGVEVVRLSDQKMLYARDAEFLFQPASNMKLFTAACALERLGPDFKERTTVETANPPDAAGHVGDIYLVGRGDPDMSGRVLPYHLKTERQSPADAAFKALAAQVAAHGVKVVTGNIIADDTYFSGSPYPPDWAVDDTPWGYGAPVTALAFNDNELEMHVQPAATVGEPAVISIHPLPNYYHVLNEVQTDAADTLTKINVARAPGTKDLAVSGEVPAGSSGDDETIAIKNPAKVIGEIFRRDLEALGIDVQGRVMVENAPPVPAAPHPVVLAERDSPPLSEDIEMTLKVSQNLHAEMLLRTLAHQLTGEGSRKAGLSILRDYAASFGITPHEIFFVDGSGLSRADLVAPAAVVKLLVHMSQSPEFSAFESALPIAGVDGTLADTFKGTPAEGRIHAKTGSIEHVNTLSGYMQLPQGATLAFCIMLNNDPLHSSDGWKIVNRVALAIFRYYLRKGAKN